MPVNPFVEQRRIMQEIMYRLVIGHRELPEKKIVALFCLKTGISEKTANKYLQELKDAEVLNIEEKQPQKTLNELTGQTTKNNTNESSP